MSDLRELYQEIILDHYRRPRNFHAMEQPTGKAEGYNPLCGDRMSVFVEMDGDVIKDMSFEGTGCAISTASASIMTEALKGKTRDEALALFDEFHQMVTGDKPLPDVDELGKLAAFSGVREFPVRIKCAILAWHALKAALESKDARVSTE